MRQTSSSIPKCDWSCCRHHRCALAAISDNYIEVNARDDHHIRRHDAVRWAQPLAGCDAASGRHVWLRQTASKSVATTAMHFQVPAPQRFRRSVQQHGSSMVFPVGLLASSNGPGGLWQLPLCLGGCQSKTAARQAQRDCISKNVVSDAAKLLGERSTLGSRTKARHAQKQQLEPLNDKKESCCATGKQKAAMTRAS